jgi:hypothetical protein
MEAKIKWLLLALTIIGLSICVPIYFFRIVPLSLEINDPSQAPVQTTRFNIHTGDVSGTIVYSLDITFIPTATTKPDQVYNIVVDNNITTVTYNVQWNQSELDASEPKPLTVDISNDQYIALIQKAEHNLIISEWKPNHNFFLILPWIITLVFFLSLIIYRTIKPEKQSAKLKHLKVKKKLKGERPKLHFTT